MIKATADAPRMPASDSHAAPKAAAPNLSEVRRPPPQESLDEAPNEPDFRALVEQQDELVLLARPGGRMIYLNQACARLLGRSPSQMVGMVLFELIAPPDREVARERFAAVAADGVTREGESRLVGADGTETWIAWTVKLNRDGQSQPTLHSVGRDMTESKRLEQRLAESERFARHVTDNLPVRIAYVDKERRYQFVNKAHCRSFGLSRDEIIGRARSELIRGPNDPLVEQRIEAALAGRRQQFEFEETIDGVRRLVEGRLIPDIDNDGAVRGYFSTNVDITERAAAEAALRELTAILENSTDYVAQTDRHGTINYMNPALLRAAGLAPDAPLPALKFAQFNTADSNRIFNQVVSQAAQSGSVWIGETTLVPAPGREIPVSHMVIAHQDERGCVTRFSSVMRDISTEVEAKRDMLRQTATLRSVTEAIPSSVAVIGADGRYRFANGAFERWVGLPRDRIVGRMAVEVLGRDEWKRRGPWSKRALAGETVSFELDYPSRGDTHLAINYIPLLLDSGEVEGLVAVTHDITSQKQEQGRLLQLSQRDSLTGLLNRAGFEQALTDGTGRGGADASLAILYIDLDRFKPVNDRYGHPAGDRTLQLFAQRLRSLVRPSDAVARLGGDEFAMALFGVQAIANAQLIADKVIAAANLPFQIGALMIHIGASVGIAFCANRSVPPRDLVEMADAQLLQAKAAGRGRYSGSMPL